MASLKDLRRRISSVKNTRQITAAMKLVAASKLRRAQMAIQGARPYAERIEEVTKRLVSELVQATGGLTEEKKVEFLQSLHPLLGTPKTEGEPKQALIVISSDRGLCGAYNTNVGKFGSKYYKELEAAGTKVDLFFYGKKAKDIFKRYGLDGTLIDFWEKNLTTKATDKVADLWVNKFLSGEYSKVEFIFTEFRSAISQTPKAHTLLPLNMAKVATATEPQKNDLAFIYEPEKKQILANVIPRQIKTQTYRFFADAYASEMGSRMTSMENATKNAGDMINRLSLLANRTRQAAITTELTEIVGGAEALKGLNL